MKILIICLLCFVCLFTVSASQSPPKWEYKVEAGVSQKKMNALADEGWEVVDTGNDHSGLPYVVYRRAK